VRKTVLPLLLRGHGKRNFVFAANCAERTYFTHFITHLIGQKQHYEHKNTTKKTSG
jgi:hypothetical protein